MKRILFFSMAASALVLSGCNAEEVKTVDWWKENEQARLEKLEECLGTDDEAVRKSPNCVNAIEARNSIRLRGKNEEDLFKAPRIN